MARGYEKIIEDNHVGMYADYAGGKGHGYEDKSRD